MMPLFSFFLPGCQWSHGDTHGGRLQSQPAGFGSYAVTCGSAAIRSLQQMAAAL